MICATMLLSNAITINKTVIQSVSLTYWDIIGPHRRKSTGKCRLKYLLAQLQSKRHVRFTNLPRDLHRKQ